MVGLVAGGGERTDSKARDALTCTATMLDVPLRAEIQYRAQHLRRVMKAGLPPLWVVITALVAIVGGSVAITIAWGTRHLLWGVVIALTVVLTVIMEGAYREFRRYERAHAGELGAEREKYQKALEAQHEAEERLKEEQSKAPVRRGASPGAILRAAAASMPTDLDLEVRIDRHTKYQVGDKAVILEIDYSVYNRGDTTRGITPVSLTGPLYLSPSDDMEVTREEHAIEERRARDRLPQSVLPWETARGVYVVAFQLGVPLQYTLTIKDDFDRLYTARPPIAGKGEG